MERRWWKNKDDVWGRLVKGEDRCEEVCMGEGG